MFNPLVDRIDDLTDTELENKINDLSKKYFMSKNPQVHSQIAAILDMYKEELRARRARAQLKQQNNNDDDLDNLINIS